MAQHSIWKAKFHIGGSFYTTFVGISGGSRKDGQIPTTAASILSAINANLLNIFKEMGLGTGQTMTVAPGGPVVLDSFEPGSIPDCWE